GFGDLLIGQDEWAAERERQIMLPRDRLKFDREPHGFFQVGAERDHAVIGEEAAVPPLERLKRKVRQFFRSVARVTSTSDVGPTEGGYHIVAGGDFLAGGRQDGRVGRVRMYDRADVRGGLAVWERKLQFPQ